MKCVYRMRPYELEPGIVNRKHKIWEQRAISFLEGSSVSHSQFKKMCRDMVHEFDLIPISDEKKPRVGIVGEILVKFLPAANNHLAELLEAEGAEAVCPDLIDFINYCFYNQNFKCEFLGFKKNPKQPLPTGVSRESNGSVRLLMRHLHRVATLHHLPTLLIWQKWQHRLYPRVTRLVRGGS